MAKRQSRTGAYSIGWWALSPAPTQSQQWSSPGEGRWEPPADVIFSDGCYVIQMEVAGLRPEQIELTADGRTLKVSGHRARGVPVARCEYRQVEIPYGPFERSFEFRFLLAEATLDATCENGFLTIRVRPPEPTKRRIAVDPPV